MIASLPPRPLPQYETHLASSHRHACHAYRTYCRICYIRYLRHGRIVLHRNTSLARLVATLVGDPGLAKTREEERAALERSLNEARSALSTAQQRLYTEVERLRAEVSELEVRAQEAERARDELLNSEFWRATAPIRAAVTKLRGRRES